MLEKDKKDFHFDFSNEEQIKLIDNHFRDYEKKATNNYYAIKGRGLREIGCVGFDIPINKSQDRNARYSVIDKLIKPENLDAVTTFGGKNAYYSIVAETKGVYPNYEGHQTEMKDFDGTPIETRFLGIEEMIESEETRKCFIIPLNKNADPLLKLK